MKALPFYLTLSRIVGAPLLALPFLKNTPFVWWVVCLIFIALSVTDYFDGKLARKYNVVSNFGKFFDPTGDKILVLFALVTLAHFKEASPFFLLILISRDILIGSLRSYAASMQVVLAARFLGKIKTTLQMIALPCMMAPSLFEISLYTLGNALLWGACVVSVLSLFDYAQQLRTHLTSS